MHYFYAVNIYRKEFLKIPIYQYMLKYRKLVDF